MTFYIDYILVPLYLLLPAYIANMSPVIFRYKLKFLDVPLDRGKKLGSQEIFGRNKTLRGFIIGTLMGIVTAYVQYLFQKKGIFESIHYLDYTHFIQIGFLLGFGALFGDLAKSFIKRRLGIAPGSKFVPFDQLDFVIGAFLFLSILEIPSAAIIASALVMSFFLHILTNRIGFMLKLKEEKW